MALMDGGQILEEGPPLQFFEAAQHERTRTFLSKIL
jgi:polar amino acid transport system ATP-binding protein